MTPKVKALDPKYSIVDPLAKHSRRGSIAEDILAKPVPMASPERLGAGTVVDMAAYRRYNPVGQDSPVQRGLWATPKGDSIPASRSTKFTPALVGAAGLPLMGLFSFFGRKVQFKAIPEGNKEAESLPPAIAVRSGESLPARATRSFNALWWKNKNGEELSNIIQKIVEAPGNSSSDIALALTEIALNPKVSESDIFRKILPAVKRHCYPGQTLHFASEIASSTLVKNPESFKKLIKVMEWTNSFWAFLGAGTLLPNDSYIAEALGELTKNPYLSPKLYEEVMNKILERDSMTYLDVLKQKHPLRERYLNSNLEKFYVIMEKNNAWLNPHRGGSYAEAYIELLSQIPVEAAVLQRAKEKLVALVGPAIEKVIQGDHLLPTENEKRQL